MYLPYFLQVLDTNGTIDKDRNDKPHAEVRHHAMTIKELDCVIAVANTRSYTIASQHLFLSTSTISYQIKHLEEELGFLVFEADNRVLLTKAGQIIYEQAIQMTDLWAKSVQAARKVDNETRIPLNIGMRRLMDEEKLSLLLETFYFQQEEYGFTLFMYRQGSFVKDLLSGNRDIIFADNTEIEKNDQIKFLPLCPTYNGYAVSVKNPLSKKKFISYEDLQNEHIMLPAVPPDSEESPHAVLLRRYCPTAIISYSPGHENAILSAAANISVSAISFTVPSSNPHVVFVPAEGCENLKLGIAWRRDDMSLGVKLFVETAKHIFN